MSSNPDTGLVRDEPLPLTNDEQTSTVPAHHSRSPSTHDPIAEDADPTPVLDTTPGAGQPRFLGAALYSGQPDVPHSYVSSQSSFPVSSSVNNSSGYALNPNGGTMGYKDDPRSSSPEQPGNAPLSSADQNTFLDEKITNRPEKSRRKMILWVILAGLGTVLLVVLLVVYFLVIKPKNQTRNGGSKASSATSAVAPASTSTSKSNVAIKGGDGSTVTMEDGSTFVYRNSFGGQWHYDENDPFNNGARAQSWSPALNETFRYGIDQIRGVNLGGWLMTEPFISPALYQKYLTPTPPMDEWMLGQAMRADTAGGGIDQLETHYKTFITEKDFAEIAAAGLNYLRIPIGYWAIEVLDGEPFLAKISWKYFLKAIKWARKYGLRINLDLHALPGSQNHWNHSGRLGTIGFLNGPMGYVNAQRSLDYIRIFAEFISQPQYKDVVTMFGIMNEPEGKIYGKENLARFYLQAYEIVRNAGGTGAGNGPFISLHDGFFARSDWVDMFPNADRLAIDTHPYLAFATPSDSPMSTYATMPCSWGADVNASMGAFGLTAAGEFSNAVNDCAFYLNGVGTGSRFDGTYGGAARIGSCTPWNDYENYDTAMKSSIRQFALSSMDGLQNYFFWTWKIGNSSTSGKVEAPAWSYQLGLQHGWMPTDPRDAIGFCGVSNPSWTPPLRSWQTGGGDIGIPPSVSSSYAWPPTTISQAGSVSTLPFYTPTGPIPTLPVPTFTPRQSVNAGNGWANPSDTTRMHVPIPTCTYLDAWVDPGTAPPASCGAAVVRRADPPLITPVPTTPS